MARSTHATPLVDSPAEPAGASERRRQTRRKINSLVYLNVERDNGGILLDFSEGGMCISVANPLVKSSTIQFSLRLEENWRVDGTGRVCWVSASGRSAGVHFLDLPASARQWILRGLGDTSPAAETESAEILLETPPSAPQPDQPAAVPSKAQPAPTTCEPKKPAEQNSPAPVAPTPMPIARAPLETPEAQRQSDSAVEESSTAVLLPQTSLLFLLPPKPEAEERPAADSSTGTESSAPFQESRPLDGSEIKAVYAPLLQPRRIPSKLEEFNRLLKDVLVTTAIVATVIAIGIVIIFLYTGGGAGTSRAVPTGGPLSLGPSTAQGGEANSPRGKENFPVEVADASGKRWIVMATGRTPIASESPFVAAGDKFSSGSIAASDARDVSPLDSALAGIPDPKTEGSLWGLNLSKNGEDSQAPDAHAGRSSAKRVETGNPIVVEARVAKNGMVLYARLLSSPHSPLARSIEESVRHWHYRPLLRRGRAVAFTTRIRFDIPSGESAH